MEKQPDSGLEFILDNRGLIVTFGLLIVVCGVFFVLGFVEGKRQGAAAAVKTATELKSADPDRSATEIPSAKPADVEKIPTNTPAAKSGENSGAQAVKEQLDWYSNVSKRGQESAKLEPPKTTVNPQPGQRDVRKAAATAPSNATYSVQIGAFRKLEDADKIGAVLKAKGYEYRIDPPVEPGQPLYLLKVGNYGSRAEAVASALRLKKDGFNTFIKTN